MSSAGFFGFGGLLLRQLCVFAIDGGSEGGPGFSPDFLWNLVASVNFMRLSSRKGARAVLSSASWQEIRVREMAKKCELSELIRLLRGFFGFGGL